MKEQRQFAKKLASLIASAVTYTKLHLPNYYAVYACLLYTSDAADE